MNVLIQLALIEGELISFACRAEVQLARLRHIKVTQRDLPAAESGLDCGELRTSFGHELP